MKKILATLLLSLSAVSAHAWGPVEQAALAAIAGGFLIGRATAEPTPPPAVYYAPPPQVTYESHYYTPRPRRQCFTVPLYDGYGRFVQTVRRCEYVHH